MHIFFQGEAIATFCFMPCTTPHILITYAFTNTGAVNALMQQLDRGEIDPNAQDSERGGLNDLNVVSSLLKLFFRKLPEALVTEGEYCTSLLLPRLPKLPCQCYSNGLGNVGNLGNNKELNLYFLVVC